MAFAGIALAEPLKVQPGVTAPTSAAPAPQPPSATDQPAQLHSATPQANSQTPRRRAPKPSPTPTPQPREVHIGDLNAPVPNVVPDAVVDGVNHTNQDLQNIIKPTPTPTPHH